jgi:hypothetical protein
MKLSEMRVNSAAIEGGRWVALVAFPGVEVKVRGMKGKGYRRELQRLVSELPMQDKLKLSEDPDISDRLDIQMMSSYLLLDWRGIEDDNGEPVPFSAEKAKETLSNPDMVEFRDAVDYAVKIVGNDALVSAETAAKN